MKYFTVSQGLLWALFLYQHPPLYAQFPAYPKHGRCWMLGIGTDPSNPHPDFMGMILEFDENAETPTVTTQPDSYTRFVDHPMCISDSSGQLQFYANGCRIKNRYHREIVNGHEINFPGYVYDESCGWKDYEEYMFAKNSTLMLPIPASEGHYIYFHQRYDHLELTIHTIQRPTSFLITEIDGHAAGGEGEAVRKNHVVVQDTFIPMVSSVRHGNGRDWWVCTPKYKADEMFMVLLGPGAQTAVSRRPVPTRWNVPHGAGYQSCFSPDGSWYARCDEYGNGLQVFSFDRCSGEFSSPLVANVTSDQGHTGASGVAFSPNSRFVYASNGLDLYQFDLQAPDFEGSKVLLGTYDNFTDFVFPTTFYQMSLAPNGKIYMSNTNGTHYLHTIHRPNEKGTACDFRQHDLRLPCYKGFALPVHPNFALGALSGSPCDSLVKPCHIAGDDDFSRLTAYPSPSAYEVTLALPPCTSDSVSVGDGPDWAVEIYAVDGKRVAWHRGLSPKEKLKINVSTWASGVYVALLRRRGEPDQAAKFLVVD